MSKQINNINSILIANRGEIASRVIRTCRKMGIRSIAVFSDSDSDAPFVEEADVSVHIGESSVAASYLDQDKIIDAAKRTGADAIHPGYGFLSENVGFVKRCEAEGVLFIGPNSEAIDAMGSKSKAKALMESHDVPTVPGYKGEDQSLATLTRAAKDIGFPVLLKATAGGGGKGMRIVHKAEGLEKAIEAAKRESKSAFGDDELIVEKYIASGRHIEFQIFGDRHGNAIHILERECTIQRRYQKVIEESPSPVLDEKLRDAMGSAAVRAAKALNYDNAGTVEFIFDEQTKDYYFLEVNTRLQVEHPVTECVTGLDLVQMQIESAQGIPLRIDQSGVKGTGYAIECRLYAEDASNDFLPVTGTIVNFQVPEVEGLRVDTAIRTGSEISAFYDPMIAKLIVWDHDRASAHRKMEYVLRNLSCQGIITNQDFLLHLVEHADFKQGKYNTHFITDKIDTKAFSGKQRDEVELACLSACLFDWQKRQDSRGLLRSLPSGWRSNFNDYQQETYLAGNEEYVLKYRYLNGKFLIPREEGHQVVQLVSAANNGVTLQKDGVQSTFLISGSGNQRFVQNEEIGLLTLTKKERFPAKEAEEVKGGYAAPMPSQIIKILVEVGQAVKSGDGLVVLSSMKMENTIEAAEDGVVEAVYTAEGANVEAGFLLLKMVSGEE